MRPHRRYRRRSPWQTQCCRQDLVPAKGRWGRPRPKEATMSEQQQTPATPTRGSPDALAGAWAQMFSAPFQSWSDTWGGFSPGPTSASASSSLEKAFAENPVLASIDKVWNANPLHDVIPIDWAGIAHALRVVAARSMANPGQAMARAVQFNADVLRSATEAWTEAGPPLARPDFDGWQAGGGWRQALRRTGMAAEPGLPYL